MSYIPVVSRSILAPPDYNLVRWIESNRYLDRVSSAEVGLKKLSRTPYIIPLYDWFLDENIKEIVIQKPAQRGVTDWVVDCLCWIAKNDPSPTALYLSDQDTARKIMTFRIEPAFRQLGLLKKNVAKNSKQEITKFEIMLRNGFYLAVGWGSSISQTASMSFKRVFCDEINKPGYEIAKTEGETLGRIRKRTRTFSGSKFIILSTPTLEDGRVTAELEAVDSMYEYMAPCKNCGTFERLIFNNIIWNGGKNASKSEISESVALKCSTCGELWSEQDRYKAIAQGKAVNVHSSDMVETVGYQIPGFSSLFPGDTMTAIVDEFISSKDDPEKLQNVINSVFGEPWQDTASHSQSDAAQLVAGCKGVLPALTLPDNTICLVMGVDVQQDGFWYRIRAVTADSTYGVDMGYVHSWEELEYIAFERRIDDMGVWRLLIDTGGTRDKDSIISRTEETYNWIQRNRGRGVQLFGCKGSSYSMPTKIKIGQPLEKTPSGKPLKNGLRIIQVNTGVVKDAIWWKIEHTNEEPEALGNWYIESDAEDWYISHMTAEQKRKNRKTKAVEWVAIRKDNHIFDCEVLLYVAIDPELYGGIRGIIAQQRAKQRAAVRKRATPRPKSIVGSNPFLAGIYD